MIRRDALAALVASTFMGSNAEAAGAPNTYLELKTWRFHNSEENQGARLKDYLNNGLAPATERSGAKFAGAFATIVAPDTPFYLTVVQYPSLGAMQESLAAIARDNAHNEALRKLSAGPGLPFVRVDSALLRTFDSVPQVRGAAPGKAPSVFELRTYESQTFLTLARKVGMFNEGEAAIFERLGMRPLFFGERVVGPGQPSLTYMLSFDSLAERERLWQVFVNDPEWKKLSSRPELQDALIVKNITNAILSPLPLS